MSNNKHRKKLASSKQKGFTIIEVIIYVGLFAFIMTSALVSVYAILESSMRNQTKAIVEEEGSFLLGKIDWVLTGIKSASVSVDGMTLSVAKFDSSVGNPLVAQILGGNMLIIRGNNPGQEINNSNIQLTCGTSGCFTHTLQSGDGINPENVSVNFTVNAKTENGLSYSQSFSTLKYLRK